MNQKIKQKDEKDEYLINYYNVIPKEMKNNELYSKATDMKIPYRLIIVGSSGSGKSNLLLNIIRFQSNIFENIVLITKNSDEPLYNYMKSKISPDQFQIIENMEQLESPEAYQPTEKKGQVLVIFDDCCLDKDQSKIAQFYIRARKLNISCIYLTQSYTKCDITVRRNSNYLILKKIPNNKDIVHILNDFSFNVDKKLLLKMYKDSTKDLLDFLMIDIDAPHENKFRKGFKHLILY